MSDKLTKLRGLFGSVVVGGRPLSAFIVPSADAHQSEYVSDRDERRSWLSGFTGSAGTAVVTEDKAALWTDGRYYLQASQQLSEDWTLMKQGLKDTPSIEAWLASNLEAGAVVGVDPFLTSVPGAKNMEAAFKDKGIVLHPVDNNLVDQIWDDQPPRPSNAVMVHPVSYAGQASTDKVAAVRTKMAGKQAAGLVVSALDDIAWLFNIRGADIVFNPVSIAYALVTETDVRLYIDDVKLTDEVKAHLGDVVLRPYEAVVEDLAAFAASLDGGSANKVWLDSVSANLALANAVPEARRILAAGPIALMKSCKNDVEIEGMRQAHLRDAAALVSFFCWLEQQVTTGAGAGAGAGAEESKSADELTEFTVSEKAAEFRSKQSDFVSLSFATIAGSGPNGAIIHYKPEADTAAPVTADRLFLCDSGGQYRDGTTDVTRTLHFGTPTAYEKKCYTLVLQGHIGLATAVFPKGTAGNMLDTLARLPLWKSGLEYRHGTGHGVGAFLNVHEGPQGVSFRARSYTGGLQPGMTVTDEPGYYETGKFGIRIESVLVVRPKAFDAPFEDMEFMEFENITYVPIQTKLIDTDLLSKEELAWVNDYNAMVLGKVSPLLSGAELEYLKKECQPLSTV